MIPFPNKKYDIIYADPPWSFGGSGGTKWKKADYYYPTLSFDELKKIPINQIAADNCLLFLWVVGSKLKECIEVGESWGFNMLPMGLFGIRKELMLEIIQCLNVRFV